MVERYLRHRGGRQNIQPGDRAALRRWLSVLREAGAIAPATPPPISQHGRIFAEFADYLRRERGLAPRSIIRHLPVIRRFLYEMCPGGAGDLGRIRQEDVIGYIERHARDWSPKTGMAMCWSLRAFLRYLHHVGLNETALAGSVPSIRQWKLTSLPTYLSTAQVQSVLAGCDRSSAIGRRDYALMPPQARPAAGDQRSTRRCRLARQRDRRSRRAGSARIRPRDGAAVVRHPHGRLSSSPSVRRAIAPTSACVRGWSRDRQDGSNGGHPRL
jgi:hypothetical protein